jgi:serine/threonine protein kinase
MDFQRFGFYESSGEETFGDFHRALDKDTNELFLNKSISLSNLQHDFRSGTIPFYWRAEIEAMKTFNHSYIIKFYGSFQVSNTYYIVMKYVDGEMLKTSSQNQRSQNIALNENDLPVDFCFEISS